MSVAVPRQKKDLEKQHTGRPDGRPTAEPGQDILRDQGLNLEEQKRGCKDRHSVRQDTQHRGTCMMDHGKPREPRKEFIETLSGKDDDLLADS